MRGLSTIEPCSEMALHDLLQSVRSTTTEEPKISALAKLRDHAIHEANKKDIVESGGIVLLVDLLRNGTDEQKSIAAATLRNLSLASATTKSQISKCGAIEALVILVRDGTSEQKRQAAGALLSLAFDDWMQFAITNAGGIEAALNLVQCGPDELTQLGLRILHELMSTRDNRTKLQALGGIRGLVDSLNDCSDAVKVLTLSVFDSVASDGSEAVQYLVEAGAMKDLLEMVQDKRPQLRQCAAALLTTIVLESFDHKRAFVEQGGVEVFIRLLREGDLDQRESAVTVLGDLSGFQLFGDAIRENGGLNALLEVERGCSSHEKICLSIICRMLRNQQDTHHRDPDDQDSDSVGGVDYPDESGECDLSRYQLDIVCQRLKTGDDAQKKEALLSLRALSRSRQCRWVMRRSKCVNQLIELVRGGAGDECEEACQVLGNLAYDDPETRFRISGLNGIAPLLKLISAGSVAQKAAAAKTLWNVVCNSTLNKILVVELGGIPHLVAQARDGMTLEKINATGVLANIARIPALGAAIVSANGIAPLVNGIRHGTNAMMLSAAQALNNLSMHKVSKIAVAKSGGIDALLDQLSTSLLHGTIREKCTLVEALWRLSTVHDVFDLSVSRWSNLESIELLVCDDTVLRERPTIDLLVRFASVESLKTKAVCLLVRNLEKGYPAKDKNVVEVFHAMVKVKMLYYTIHHERGVWPLVRVLRLSDRETKQLAAEVIQELAGVDATVRDSCGHAGAIPALVGHISNGTEIEIVTAITTLQIVVFRHKKNCKRVVECGGLKKILRIVRKSDSSNEQERTAALLANLVIESSARRVLIKSDSIDILIKSLRKGTAISRKFMLSTLRQLIGSETGEDFDTGSDCEPSQSTECTKAHCLSVVTEVDTGTHKAIADHVAALVALIEHGTTRQKYVAVAAVANLIDETTSAVVDFRTAADVLVAVSRDGTDAQRSTALVALARLSLQQGAQPASLDPACAVELIDIVKANNSTDADKENCLRTLRNLASTARGSIAIELAGGIDLAVQFLDDATDKQKRYAAGLLKRLGQHSPAFREQIVNCGAIPRLVNLVRVAPGDLKETAACALGSVGPGYEPSIVNAGGVLALLELSQLGTATQKKLAASSLLALSRGSEKTTILETALGFMGVLIEMLQFSSSDAEKLLSLRCLCLVDDVERRTAIAEGGAIPPTVELLRSGKKSHQLKAAELLMRLSYGHPTNRARIVEAGGIAAALDFIRDGTQEQIPVVVVRNATTGNEAAVVEAGAVDVMLQLAQSGADPQKEHAVATLKFIAIVAEHRPAIVRAGGVQILYEIAGKARARQLKRSARHTLHYLARTEKIGFVVGPFAFIRRPKKQRQ